MSNSISKNKIFFHETFFFDTKFQFSFDHKSIVFPYGDLQRKFDEFVCKKKQFRYLNAQKELDAHLFTIDSPDEYYNWAEYERLTPTHVWVVWNWKFLRILHFTKEPIVFWCHCPNTVFFITSSSEKKPPILDQKKSFMKKYFIFGNRVWQSMPGLIFIGIGPL